MSQMQPIGGHSGPSKFRRAFDRLFGPKNSRQFIVVSAIVVSVVATVVAAAIIGIYKAATGPDASVDVRAQVDQDAILDNGRPVGASYVLPVPRADVDAPPAGAETSCSGRYAWAMAQDGVVAIVANVRVTLSPRDSESLVVDGVEVVPVETRDPTSGVVATCSGGGGSDPADPSTLEVGLARDSRPSVSFRKPDGTPADFVYELAGSSTATFDVVAEAADCDCSFYLRLTGTQDGEAVEIDVKGPDGEPFRVTSIDRADPAFYDPQTGSWVLQGVADGPVVDYADLALGEVGSSACELLDVSPISGRVGVELVRGSGSDEFQPGLAPGGGNMGASVCSWSSGPPDDSGGIATLGVEHLVAPDAASADQILAAIKDGMSPSGAWSETEVDGWSVYVQAPGFASTLWRSGRFVIVVTGTSGLESEVVRLATASLLPTFGS